MAKFFMSTFPPESKDKTEDVVCVSGAYFSVGSLFDLGFVTGVEALPVKAGSPAKTKLIMRDGEDVNIVHVLKPFEECQALYDKAHDISPTPRSNHGISAYNILMTLGL